MKNQIIIFNNISRGTVTISVEEYDDYKTKENESIAKVEAAEKVSLVCSKLFVDLIMNCGEETVNHVCGKMDICIVFEDTNIGRTAKAGRENASRKIKFNNKSGFITVENINTK